MGLSCDLTNVFHLLVTIQIDFVEEQNKGVSFVYWLRCQCRIL